MPQEIKTAAPANAGLQLPVTRPVAFRDKAFKSRTIVFADGSTASVVNSAITVSSTERADQLDQLGDFERTDPGA